MPCFGSMVWLKASTGDSHNKTITRTKSIISETIFEVAKNKQAIKK